MIKIFVDADGCAVKDEIYKVASRYPVKVIVVANKNLPIPLSENIEMRVASKDFDAADDLIAEEIMEFDLLITSDLLLADRCIKKNAKVLGPKGRELNEDNIGNSLGGRELSAHLRQLGDNNTGPKPMGKSDRSNFLSKLDQMINASLKASR